MRTTKQHASRRSKYSITTSHNGRLVTIEKGGVHLMTIRREAAIRAGILGQPTQKRVKPTLK